MCGRQKYASFHSASLPRGYSAGSNRLDIRLVQGRNKLLVRVDQCGGEWKMSANIKGKDGKPLAGIEYTLE